MDRGLAYIRYTNKLSYYHTTEGISSAVYTATLWNDYLFIGTNQEYTSVHKEKTKDLEMFSSMKFLKGTEGQVWAFKQIDGQLFVVITRDC